MRRVPAGPVAAFPDLANRDSAARLVADVAIHVGVHHILAGSVNHGEGLTKFIPSPRRADLEKRIVNAVVKCPAQRQFARFTRNKIGNDRPVARDYDIHHDIWLAFDVDGLATMLRFAPSLRRFILALRIKLLDV